MSDLGENRIAFLPKDTKRIADLGASYTYFADGDVLVAKVTPCFENGKAGVARGLTNGVGFGSSEFYVLRPTDRVLAEFVYFCVTSEIFRGPAIAQMTGTGGLQRVPRGYLEQFRIPLPPLEVQKELVAEIEGYQRVIDGASAVLDNYRPHIPIHADWPMVELGNVFKLSSGRGLTQAQMRDGPYPVYGGNGRSGLHSEYFVEDPIIVIGRVGAYCGAVHITEPRAWVTDNGLYVTEYKTEVDQRFLAQALAQLNLNQFSKVGGQPSISQTTVYERRVSLPSLATQQAIVAEIEAEQALVAANRRLIDRLENKIQSTLARVWGEKAEPTPAAEA
jgi:type I restriction enzyme M protein